MSLESATRIDQLVPENPPEADPVFQGAAHLRLLKTILKTTFPSITTPITLTSADINALPAAIAASSNVSVKLNPAAGARQNITGPIGVTGVVETSAQFLQSGYALIPAGIITMWSGAVAAVPGGWALCNGANGTPDLRDRFVVPAGGGYGVGVVGGAAIMSGVSSTTAGHDHGGTQAAGAHNHGAAVGATVITTAQMPVHSHTAAADTQGQHQHTLRVYGGTTEFATGDGRTASGDATTIPGSSDVFTTPAGSHSHNVTVGAEGGGQPHGHSIASDGSHAHALTLDGGHSHSYSFDNRPPYYALAFIMKL